MDVNQIAKMIEWLDEERRRDKQMIATLEERLGQQQETISTLQRRVNSVESDQTVMRGSGSAIGSNELLEQTRAEMRQLLESTEARRLTAEREADRRVEISREQMQRAMREMQEQLERLQRSTGMVNEFKTEGSRVADNLTVVSQRLDDLGKRLEEPDRRLTFLE
jgi:chromosome segregation ATPase